MSYLTQADIAANTAMRQRVAQAAAQQGRTDPDQWAARYSRQWASAPGWDSAWESALVSNAGDPEYDPGTDEGVITDAMILSQVQTMPNTQ